MGMTLRKGAGKAKSILIMPGLGEGSDPKLGRVLANALVDVLAQWRNPDSLPSPMLPLLSTWLLHPLLAVYILLFVLRIFLSWYPQLDTQKFPTSWVVGSTEFLLKPTRKIVPLWGGVDMSPVVWVGIVSLLREILLGQQGLVTMALH